MSEVSPETKQRRPAREAEREPVRAISRPVVKELPGGALEALMPDGSSVTLGAYVADPWAVPPNLIPDGMSLEWKTEVVLNQEQTEHQNTLHHGGWRSVPADNDIGRHFLGPTAKGAIRKDGMVLMWRPMAFTERRRQQVADKTLGYTQQQRQQFGLAAPTGFDTSHNAIRPVINRSVEPAPLRRDMVPIEK